MYMLLRIIRVLFGFVAFWQIFALYPIIGWIPHISQVTGQVWALVVLHVVVFVVFAGLFIGLRVLINKLHTKQYGHPHPALAKFMSF